MAMLKENVILCTDNECRFTDVDVMRLQRSGHLLVSADNSMPTLLPQVIDADIVVASCFATVPEHLIEAATRVFARLARELLGAARTRRQRRVHEWPAGASA